jgi:hypothetical protein
VIDPEDIKVPALPAFQEAMKQPAETLTLLMANFPNEIAAMLEALRDDG